MRRVQVMVATMALCVCVMGCEVETSTHDATVNAISEAYVDKLAGLARAGLLKAGIEDPDWPQAQ